MRVKLNRHFSSASIYGGFTIVAATAAVFGAVAGFYNPDASAELTVAGVINGGSAGWAGSATWDSIKQFRRDGGPAITLER